MKTFKITTLTVLFTLFLITSCNNDTTAPEQTDEKLIQLSLEVLEDLSKTYPPEDIEIVFSKNENNQKEALFRLKGETKAAAELGYFARTSEGEEGTTCNSAFSCGKAIKKCLDEGQDALISSGACTGYAEYCVTCQNPQ